MLDFKEIFESTERVNIEFKSAQGGLPSSIWETYSAFANTFGGKIILGVGEDKETKKPIPLGVTDPEKLQTEIWNTINNSQKISGNILLERNVYIQEYENNKYVVIEVPRATRQDKPVYVGTDIFKGSFRRNHEGDYHCTKSEVKAMLRDQSDTSADSSVLDDVGLEALNSDSIKSYRTRFEVIRSNHAWNGLPTDEFLIKIGAARHSEVDGKIHPTLGGLIFFGDFISITNELPGYFLDYREKLSTDTRWTDRVCSGDGDWSGNVYDFYFKIIDRLTSDVKKPFAINDQLLRDDDTPVHRSLREALANSLIHADYYGRQGIVIEKSFRTTKFSNPGNFRISVDDAIAGGISDCRNGRIFNMFSLIKVGERSGTGLCDIYDVWKKYGYERPVITETVEPDRTSLTLNIESARRTSSVTYENEVINSKNEAINEVIKETINYNTGHGSENLTEKERLILKTISDNPSITKTGISQTTGFSVSTIDRNLKSLKEKGLIKRTGSNKTGRWMTKRVTL